MLLGVPFLPLKLPATHLVLAYGTVLSLHPVPVDQCYPEGTSFLPLTP
jgi:hypothetical protein